MDYLQAKKIREKSFGTLLAEQEGGFGHSFKAAISKKTQARIMGMKEKYDPLNIAKKLTGGSNWAPALLGKLFGMDKKRVDYFSGVKPKHTASLDSSESLNSPEVIECLGYIYKSLKQSIDDKHQAEADAKERKQQEESEEESRNQELIKVLTGRRKKKPTKKEKVEPKEVKPKEKPVKEKKETVTTPKVTPKVTPKTPAPTTTPSLPSATAIGGAAIVAAGTLSMSKAIAQGESAKGSYNAANKGTRQGKIIGIKEPINLENMTVEEVMRRQSIKWGSPNENEKLFAVGKYQMIPTTLSDAVKKLNIDPKQKFSAQLQERLFEEYLIGQKNPAITKYLNSPVDDPTLLYKALKSLSNEWASIADPDIPGGTTSHYGSGNKASISVTQMTTLLKQDRENLQKRKLTQEPSTTATGNRINVASNENKNLKTIADVESKSPMVVNTNKTSQTTQQQSSTLIVVDDKNPYLKKVKT